MVKGMSRRSAFLSRTWWFQAATLSFAVAGTFSCTPSAKVGSMSAANDKPLLWWQTNCATVESAVDDVTYVTFRRFPISTGTVDQNPERGLTLATRGLTIKTERGEYNRTWPDVVRLEAQSIGSGPTALSLTLYTREGEFGSAMLGVVELPCWKLIRGSVQRIAPSVEVLGWQPPEPPLHHDLSDLDRAMKSILQEGHRPKEEQK